jgi:hypothetical protein
VTANRSRLRSLAVIDVERILYETQQQGEIPEVPIGVAG